MSVSIYDNGLTLGRRAGKPKTAKAAATVTEPRAADGHRQCEWQGCRRPANGPKYCSPHAAQARVQAKRPKPVDVEAAPVVAADEEHVCEWTYCRQKVSTKYCPRHTFAAPGPKRFRPTPEQWEQIVADAAELRRTGLRFKEIGLRLEIPATTAARACRAAGLDGPVHGILSRWAAGCRCEICTEAMLHDPLVLAVAELRREGLKYADISARLDISLTTAQAAGQAAGFRGRRRVPGEWGTIVASVRKLRKMGLSHREIGRQLGVSAYTAGKAAQEAGLKGRVKLPAHGTKARWRSCDCRVCTKARHNDPLVSAVGKLRGTGVKYKEIAGLLGISVAAATQAGKDAGFTGRVRSPRSPVSPLCSWPECSWPALIDGHCAFHDEWTGRGFQSGGAVRVEDLPSAEREALIVTAVELRLGGMPYPQVGTRLGVPSKIVAKLCRDAGFKG
jgi:hypothetical protein